jgi:hypothetical protein
VRLDGFLRDSEFIRREFIRPCGGDPLQHVKLSVDQLVVAAVFGDLHGDCGWNVPAAGVHDANRLQQVGARAAQCGTRLRKAPATMSRTRRRRLQQLCVKDG